MYIVAVYEICSLSLGHLDGNKRKLSAELDMDHMVSYMVKHTFLGKARDIFSEIVF